MSDAKVSFHDDDWEPTDDPAKTVFFSFACPTHKGRRCELLAIRDKSEVHPSWVWDGNREAPTFSPSINHKTCWHGYITKGRCMTTQGKEEPEPVK